MLRSLAFAPFLVPLLMHYRVPLYHNVSPPWSMLLALLPVYIVIPLIDHIGGRSRANADVANKPWIADGVEYRSLPRLLGAQVIVLKIAAFVLIVRGQFPPIDLIGTAFLCGHVLGSYSMYVSHELVHRPSRFDRALAEALMLTVMYPHFCIEHVMGHHKHVGTPRDPATARFNESVYRFIARSVCGGLVSAWRLEAGRLRERGRSPFTAQNRMLRYSLEVVALNAVVYYFGGPAGIIAFLVQSAAAIFAFETINYLQHYGLRRRELAPGVFEPVTLHHSWDSSYRFSNLFLLNLGRHADHHHAPARPFQALRLFRDHEAPEMPWGIVTMFVVALVPPLWFRVMNPRVLAWRESSRDPIAEKYAKLPGGKGLDPDTALSALRRACARGDVELRVITVDRDTRRQMLLSRYEALCGFLAVPAVVTGILVNVLFAAPWGIVFLFVVCVAVLAARRRLARLGSDEAVIRAALDSLHTWDLFWRSAKVELHYGRDRSKSCRSPAQDWYRFTADIGARTEAA